VQGNLSDAQKRSVREVVAGIESEDWPRKKPRK
jgi:hypothetical protein